MKLIGLTGGIGCGKSTVGRMLVARGARLIDADELAREVVRPGEPAWRDIVAAFGQDVLNPDQTLNRDRLAAIVFQDPAKRDRLNRLTHPRIGERMLSSIKQNQAEGAPVTIVDAALLLESPATRWIKPVIVVVCKEEVRIERVCRRDGASEDQVRARVRAQWSDDDRARLADHVIDNSGDLDHLEQQVDEVWRKIGGSK